jgi:hypothetical protein
MKNLFAAICILATLISACATAGNGKNSVNISDALVLNSGQYEGNLIKRENTSDSHGKRNTYEGFEFINDSNRIPAEIGNRFGIRLVLRGEPDGEKVKIRVLRHHPPMYNPHKKRTISLSEYTRELFINTPHLIGYGFDEDWELVEGVHRFVIYYGNQKLIDKSFTVYMP